MSGIRKHTNALHRLLFHLVMVALLMPCLSGATEPPPTAMGTDLAGKPVDPLQRAQGKLVVLIFVRTDCPISNRYAPTLQSMSRQYLGKAKFWLVYPDKAQSPAAIQAHLKEYGYTMPALRDPQHSLVKRGEAEITPEAAVFNTAGALVYHGRIDNWYQDFGHARPSPTTHELADAIDATIAGVTPKVASVTGVGCYISDLR
jgi:hypothetical protein